MDTPNTPATPASPASPSTPSSPDIVSEIDRLSLNPTPARFDTSGTTASEEKRKYAAAANEEDELERFRNQWKEEVKAKKYDSTTTNGKDKKGEEKEVEVGPVRWKEKEREVYQERDSKKILTSSKSPLKSELPLEERSSSSKSDLASPEIRNTQLPTPISPTPINPKPRPKPRAANFVPGQAVDLDKLDSYLTSTTFTPFQPSSASSSRPIRYTGSIAVDGNELKNDKERAISIYSKAVESEQAGKLNEALMLYRKAFKLDDDVDRSYARSLKTKASIPNQTNGHPESEMDPLTPSSSDIISSKAPSLEPYSFARHIQTTPDYEKTHTNPTIPPSSNLPPSTSASQTTQPSIQPQYPISPLTKLFNTLSTPANELTFIPQEEELPCPIQNLPNELFEPILHHLDVTSIERLGSTCWKLRYLTHVSLTWRQIAEKIYKPPSMLPSSEFIQQQHDQENEGVILGEERKSIKSIGVRDLVKRHRNEWRTTVVEEERVRMDGCYIAVCHYIRPGAGEEWVTITHMITYHRFLRFYPDGNVISFLTTDHPSEIVPSLRPSIRGKGLHFGRWRLVRSDSDPNLDSSSMNPNGMTKDGKRYARVIITDLLEPGNDSPKYEFEMELILKSTGRGRWNKLEILEYRSINLLTGEVLALALKHQKPFYFSKVRSYNPPF